ncbi:hypothetical protein KFE25_007475 [Diacronema lutheri]|uniref:UBX domain-containing protein n=2 Tax=Diacronema lutheri TaxID=2081491 RepID=A0A8J5XUV5_DIALT|nr:hypothetical protein KFE25_007475 [Diacronema lutheri]
MDFELSLASKRLEKEATKRKQAEAARLERQRRERERVDAKRFEFEAAAAAERAAAAEAAEKLRARHEILLERNKGVWTSQRLAPQLSLAAEAKGIRRRSDKISLPRSFGEALSAQHDHAAHGPMYFELAVDGRPPTHGALLDFESPEGVVGLPPKVLRCLGLDDALGGGQPPTAAPEPARAAPQAATVTVTYRSLRAGTFAKLQPVSAAFQRELGDIKTALELELLTHATLTEGDTVRVRSLEDGGEHELRVVSLLPEHAVAIVDTDLEVDIAPSVEAEAAQAAERARAEAEAAAAHRASEAARAAAEAAEAAAATRRAEAAAARAAAAAALAPEPADGPGTVHVLVKLPSGERATRRFAHAQPLCALFEFVDACALDRPDADGGSGGIGAPSYRLAAQFPRRVWERAACADDALSIGDAGLAAKQEALLVELL